MYFLPIKDAQCGVKNKFYSKLSLSQNVFLDGTLSKFSRHCVKIILARGEFSQNLTTIIWISSKVFNQRVK